MNAPPESRGFSGLAILSFAAWIACAVQAAWWPEMSHWPARLAVLGLGGALVSRALRGPRLLLLSPLAAFGILCPVFYAVLPALMIAGPGLEGYVPAFSLDAASHYVHGRAELLVLQFAAACIAAGAAFGHFGARRLPPGRAMARPVAIAAAGLAVVLTTVLLARHRLPEMADLMRDGIGRQMLDGIAPMMSAAVAALFFHAAGRGSQWLVVAAGCGFIAAAGLLTTGAAKSAVFMLAAGIVLYIALGRPSRRAVALAAAAIAVVFVTGVGLLAEIRHGHLSSRVFGKPAAEASAGLTVVLLSKAAGRQAETGACLHRVVERHVAAPVGDSAFYFLSAVVPRALWPGKPNLSLGADYAVAYCGYRPEYMPAANPHSLSISLVGEPIVRAGLPGLAVAQAALILTLMAASRGAVRIWPAGPVALAAMAPWLSDFDQSFALYVANGVKMLLYMTPVLLAVAVSSRAPARDHLFR